MTEKLLQSKFRSFRPVTIELQTCPEKLFQSKCRRFTPVPAEQPIYPEKLFQSKCRRFRPVSTEQHIYPGYGAFFPHPPLEKRPVPPPVPPPMPKTRLGCSVLGSTPILETPPPMSKTRLGCSVLGSTPILETPPPMSKTRLGCSVLGSTPILETPPPMSKTRLGCSVLGSTPVLETPPPMPKRRLGSSVLGSTPVLEIPPPMPKRRLGSSVLGSTPVLETPPPMPKRRLGCSVLGSTPVLETPPPMPKRRLGSSVLGSTPVLEIPPPMPKRRLGSSVLGSTPVLEIPPPKRKPIRTSKGESLAPLERHPRVGASQQEERFLQQAKQKSDNLTFLQKSEAEAQRLKMAIRDDDRAFSQINKIFLDLGNEIKNLQSKSQLMEMYQSKMPYEMSVAYKGLHPWDMQRVIKRESEVIAEQQKQTSRDLMSKMEKMDRVKLKRNLIVNKRDQHNKSLKNINDRMRAAQEARKAVLKRIRDSVY